MSILRYKIKEYLVRSMIHNQKCAYCTLPIEEKLVKPIGFVVHVHDFVFIESISAFRDRLKADMASLILLSGFVNKVK